MLPARFDALIPFYTMKLGRTVNTEVGRDKHFTKNLLNFKWVLLRVVNEQHQ